MCGNNHQYKVGDKILVKRKKTLITNYNSWDHYPLHKYMKMARFASKRESSMMLPIFAE